MAINRAPFNALIDDNGTGTTGSVWNKAAIQGVLLDPIDTSILVWADNPFVAANFSAKAPLVWTVGAAAVVKNRYMLHGKTLFWSIYLSWFSGSNVMSGSPSDTLYLTLPIGLAAGTQMMPVAYTQAVAGVAVVGGLYASANGNRLEVMKGAGGNYALTDTPGIITTFLIEVS